MRSSLRRALPALGLILLLPFAACGDGEPEVKVSASPSPSVSASGPDGSDSPTAESAGSESARAFIERYFDASTEMQNSGQTQSFREVGHGCEPCVSLAERIDQIYAAGGSVDTGGTKVSAIISKQSAGGLTSVDVRTVSGPTVVIESEGAEPSQLEGGAATARFTLRKQRGGWRIVNVTRLQS